MLLLATVRYIKLNQKNSEIPTHEIRQSSIWYGGTIGLRNNHPTVWWFNVYFDRLGKIWLDSGLQTLSVSLNYWQYFEINVGPSEGGLSTHRLTISFWRLPDFWSYVTKFHFRLGISFFMAKSEFVSNSRIILVLVFTTI